MLTSRSVFCALVALTATGLLARADQLRGVVQTVDVDARKIVVKEEGTDRQVDVTVPEGTTVATAQGKFVLLKDLRRGDGVGIAHRGGVATSILVSKAPLVGVVSSKDQDKMRIVVTPAEPGKDVEVTTTAKTVFENTAGTALNLKDLRPGDRVSIIYDGPEIARVVVELRGVVQTVDVDARKIVVKEEGTDRQVDVAVPEGTSLATAQGKTVLLKDLRKGDGVGLVHRDGVATKILVNKAALVGVVSSTDQDKLRIVVTPTEPGKDVEVTTTAKTVFENTAGTALKLKDLRPGDGVSINYDGPDVTRVVVNPKGPELTGHVKRVAADLKSIVVTEVGSNNDTTVVINRDTTIVTSDGKAMEVKALKPGDGVGIAHDKGLASKIVVNVKQP